MSQMNSFLVQERREAGIMCRVQGCEREFVDMNRRDEHEKSVHDRIRLKCDLCTKSFSLSAKTSLNYHKLVSHAEGPKKVRYFLLCPNSKHCAMWSYFDSYLAQCEVCFLNFLKVIISRINQAVLVI